MEKGDGNISQRLYKPGPQGHTEHALVFVLHETDAPDIVKWPGDTYAGPDDFEPELTGELSCITG